MIKKLLKERLQKLAGIVKEQDYTNVWGGDYNPQTEGAGIMGVPWGPPELGYDGPNTSNGQQGCANLTYVGALTDYVNNVLGMSPIGTIAVMPYAGFMIMDYCLQNGILPCVFEDYYHSRVGPSYSAEGDFTGISGEVGPCLVHDQAFPIIGTNPESYHRFGKIKITANANLESDWGSDNFNPNPDGYTQFQIVWDGISSLQEFWDVTQTEYADYSDTILNGFTPSNISSWNDIVSTLETNGGADIAVTTFCNAQYCFGPAICECECNDEESGCVHKNIIDDEDVNTDISYGEDPYDVNTISSCNNVEMCCDFDAPEFEPIVAYTGQSTNYNYCLNQPWAQQCYDENFFDSSPNEGLLNACIECLVNTCNVNQYIMYYGPQGPQCNPDLCGYPVDPIEPDPCEQFNNMSPSQQTDLCLAYYKMADGGQQFDPNLASFTDNGNCCNSIKLPQPSPIPTLDKEKKRFQKLANIKPKK